MIQSEVLKHSVRRRIYEHILENPGISFKMLRNVFGLNEGTLSYHLDCLRRGDLIHIRKRKNERICVPIEKKRSQGDIGREQWMVLKAIQDHPGCSVGRIKDCTGIEAEPLQEILTSLRRKRLIDCRQVGKVHVYEPASDDDLFREMMRMLIERYVKGEISRHRLMELKRKLEEMKG